MPDPTPPSRQLALFDGLDAGPLAPAAGAASPPPAGAATVPPPVPGPSTALADAARAFDDHLARIGKTANTRRAFASDLRLVADHLGPGRGVASIRPRDLEAFVAWLLHHRGVECSPKSLARRITTLKVFFGWLAECGAVTRDPARGLVHRPAEAPDPTPLSDAEVARLLAAAHARATDRPPDPRPALLLRLVLDTGLKKGELTRLRTADVAADADPPTLLVRYDNPRWRDKERRVTFSPHVAPLLAAYVAHYRPGDRLFACTDRNLEHVLRELVASAGVEDHVGFETLRWTSALRAWRSGLEPDLLRQRLGLSPITWIETSRKLALVDPGPTGPGAVSLFYPPPGAPR